MIIRKPYAFLIKNFKKIHILMLLLSIFIYIRVLNTRTFINDFIDLGSYNVKVESISNYINFGVIISLLILVVASCFLALLLRHKQKPWKLYLIPVLEYFFLLIIFIMILEFFSGYQGETDTTSIRALRDLLFIASLPQYFIFLILIIRITGVDLNKFDFKKDEEFLGLDSEDREEVEINIQFDKASIKRLYHRLKRNIGYAYNEHKLFFNTVFTILTVVFVIYTYNYFFIVHKRYKEGQILKANSYEITVNNSYLTEKTDSGKIVEKGSYFLILDLTVKNAGAYRAINVNKYHILNGIQDYSITDETYSRDFMDFGKTYQGIELRNNTSVNFILIYKIPKKEARNRFVLYYQDFDKKGRSYVRKIKLKPDDLRKDVVRNEKKLGEELTFTVQKKKKSILIENYEFLDNASYAYKNCNASTCLVDYKDIVASPGMKILKIEFISDQYEGKDLIDFSTYYGKIEYEDTNNKRHSINIIDQVGKNYYGKYLYIKVPEKLVKAKELKLVYTLRNNKYKYQLQ